MYIVTHKKPLGRSETKPNIQSHGVSCKTALPDCYSPAGGSLDRDVGLQKLAGKASRMTGDTHCYGWMFAACLLVKTHGWL